MLQTKHSTAVDLFAGCGGLSTGLRQAGFNILAAVEKDPDAASSYQLNHPSTKVYQEDIRLLTTSRLLGDLSLSPGQLDLLAGCPPCQGFTRLTENSGRRDPRNRLVREYVRVCKILLPKVCMLENVPGLMTRGKRYFKELTAELENLGYHLVYQVVEMADYGVPQLRKRLVLLGCRVGVLEIPPPTHSREGKESGRSVWKTVEEAIGHLPPPKLSSDIEPRRSVPTWHTARSVSKEVKQRLEHAISNEGGRATLPANLRLACHARYPRGFFDVYGAMKWDEPAPTMTSGCTNASKGKFGHPAQPRPLTPREAALLQTFPRGYRFDGSGVESVARQIGNALPCRFAKILGRSILPALQADGL